MKNLSLFLAIALMAGCFRKKIYESEKVELKSYLRKEK
jgi:hypothetical protein